MLCQVCFQIIMLLIYYVVIYSSRALRGKQFKRTFACYLKLSLLLNDFIQDFLQKEPNAKLLEKKCLQKKCYCSFDKLFSYFLQKVQYVLLDAIIYLKQDKCDQVLQFHICQIVMQSVGKSLEIRECIFELTVAQATANIKFPCSFFLQWKTTNNKHSTISNNRVKATKGNIPFNQQLNLSVLMLYNLKLQHYRKKDSIVLVNLLSNSRPNDPKLVGRVEIDLANITNKNNMHQLIQYPLKYCSVDGSITLKACLKQEKITNIDPNDLERSQCSQSQIFGPEFGSHRQDKTSVLSSNLSSASKSKQKSATKPNPQAIQHTSNETKGPLGQQLLGVSDMVTIRQPKKQVRIQLNSENASNSKNNSSNGYDIEQGLEKRLKNDFSIPKLAKNTSQFNSSQINSQKTLKNEISQKSLTKLESPKFIEQRPNQFSKKTIQEDKKSDNKEVQNKKIKEVLNSPTQKPESTPYKTSSQITDNSANDNLKLKQDYQKLLTKCNQLQNQFKSKQARISELQKNIKQNNNKLQKQSDSFNEMLKKLQQMQNIKLMNESLSVQYNYKCQEFKQIGGKLANLQAQNQNLRNAILLHQETIKSLDNNDKKASEQVATSDIDYKYEIEVKNHQNTKLELEELRQWYNQLQQQTEKLAQQKLLLQQKLQQSSLNNHTQQASQNQLNEYKEHAKILLENKINQIKTLNQIVSEKEKQIFLLEINANQLKEELLGIKQQLQHQYSQGSSLNQDLKKLNQQIQQYKIILEQKQLENLSLNEEIRLAKDNTAQIQKSIQQHQKMNKNSLKQKQQAVQQRQNRLKDLVNRLKDKEQLIARLQRQKQQIESKLKQAQFSSQQFKEKLKKIEVQKQKTQQKYKDVEKQNRQIKREIEKITLKSQSDSDSFNRTVGKLKQSLDQQIQKRKQLQKSLKQQKSSTLNQKGFLKDYEEKIAGYIQRQNILKQNLEIVESQISKITDILIEKEENEEYFSQNMINLNQINTQLTIRNAQLQNQLNVSKQRCQALEAQVQLLNAYMPEQQDQTQLVEMNKKLNDKNKELLQIIQQKNKELNLFEINQGENKFNEAKKELYNSRQLKEMAELQKKVNVLEQQNQRVYKQLQKLNMKYEEQLNLLQVSNQEKVKQLLSTIQQLNSRVKSLQKKDLDTFNQQKVIKEELQKVQQGLNQKEFQAEAYKNQIQVLNQTIEGLQSQLNILNTQYENLYSEMGQKEFQLYQVNAKMKQLEQTLQAKPQEDPNLITKTDHLSEYKQKLELYQAKIREIQKTEKQRERQNVNLNNQINQLREKLQQLDFQFRKKSLQVEKYKLNQKQLELKITQAEDQHKFVTSHFKTLEQQISSENDKLKSQKEKLLQNVEILQAEIAGLQEQVADLKQNQSVFKQQSSKQIMKESQLSTPIQQFKDSPLQVYHQKQTINMRELVQQLTSIINKRKDQQEVQGVLRLVIDNNARQEQQFERWNKERGTLQQKAKLASKQLQKAKSAIMKNTTRSIAQKSQITGLLKPIQSVIGQLINLSETLSELDVDLEQDEEGQIQIEQKQGVTV